MYTMCNLLKQMCLFKKKNMFEKTIKKHQMCNFKTPNV